MKISIKHFVLATALMGSFSSGAFATAQQLADYLASKKKISLNQAKHVVDLMVQTSTTSPVANSSLSYIAAKQDKGKSDADIDAKLAKKVAAANNWSDLQQLYADSLAKAQKANAGMNNQGAGNQGAGNQGNPNVFDLVRDTPIVEGYFANSLDHVGLFSFIRANIGKTIFGSLIDQANYETFIHDIWDGVNNQGKTPQIAMDEWKNNVLDAVLKSYGFGENGNAPADLTQRTDVWNTMNVLTDKMDIASVEYTDIQVEIEHQILSMYNPELASFANDALRAAGDQNKAIQDFKNIGFSGTLDAIKQTMGFEQVKSVFPGREASFDALALTLPLFEFMKHEADATKRKELVWQFVLDKDLLGQVDKTAATATELADATKKIGDFGSAFATACPSFVFMSVDKISSHNVTLKFDGGSLDKVLSTTVINPTDTTVIHDLRGPVADLLKVGDIVVADAADIDLNDKNARSVKNAITLWQ